MGIAVIPAAGGGVTPKVQDFTSTGTFTVPSNCSMVEVFLVAGGGGGGYANNSATSSRYAAGGGAGGEVIRQQLSVTPGASYTVTIGAGGSGATSASAAGGTGGDTSFGSLLTAYGSYGGASTDSNSTVSVIRKGAGSYQNNANQSAPCGGGAGGPATYLSLIGSVAANFLNLNEYTNRRGVAGGSNFVGTGTNNTNTAGIGIDGFGNGGCGGVFYTTANGGTNGSFTSYGTGLPGFWNVATLTRTLPVNASANTGDGGGGAITSNSSPSPANGGNAGSGFARVIYWS